MTWQIFTVRSDHIQSLFSLSLLLMSSSQESHSQVGLPKKFVYFMHGFLVCAAKTSITELQITRQDGACLREGVSEGGTFYRGN